MTRALSTVDTVLDEADWHARRDRHRERVRPWVEPRPERRRNGGKHATDDFLFECYPYSEGKLMAWHPGHGTALAGGDEYLEFPQYERRGVGVTTPTAWLRSSADRLNSLTLATRLLAGMSSRPAVTGCFCRQELAMV